MSGIKKPSPLIKSILFILGVILQLATVQAQKISGFVLNEFSQAPLVGAHILIKKTNIKSTTNNHGFFEMDVPSEGNYDIIVSYVGYNSETFTLNTEEHSKTIYLKSDYHLDEVIITVERRRMSTGNVLRSASTLSFEEIQQVSPRTTPDLISRMPGITMQYTNPGGGSPFIRGLTGQQVLYLLDGIRLNNSTYRSGPSQYLNTIDALSINRVEVLRGSGSVLYGSDAIGGVVNIFTKTPKFTDKIRVGGSSHLKYLSDGMEKSVRGELQITNKNIALHGGISIRDFGDLKAGGNVGKQKNTAYDEIAADFKGKLKLNDNSTFTLAYNGVFQSEVGRYDQVAQRGYSLWMFDPQNRQIAYGMLESKSDNKWFHNIKIIASIQNSIEGRIKQKQGNSIINREKDEVTTFGGSLEIESKITSNWTMVSGAEIYYDKVRSKASEFDTSTQNETTKRGLYPDNSSALNFSLFNSHTVSLNQFRLNFGGRFNQFVLNINDDVFGETHLKPSAVVFDMNAGYTLNKSHLLTLSLNNGYRIPNIDDMSKLGSFDFGIEVPNFDLVPEKSLSYELGYKFKTPTTIINFSVYRTLLFDLISREKKGNEMLNGEQVYQKENVGEAFVHGIELSSEFFLTNGFSIFSSLAYTYGQNKTKSEPMRRIPPLNVRIELNYKTKKPGFYYQLVYIATTPQNRLSGGDIDDHRIPAGGTLGWNVLNINSGYTYKSFKVNFGLKNIFNKKYRTHGSGVDAYGRSFWVSTNFLF